jgi:hypothetical protein
MTKERVSFGITMEPVSEPTIGRAVDSINSFEFMVSPVRRLIANVALPAVDPRLIKPDTSAELVQFARLRDRPTTAVWIPS